MRADALRVCALAVVVRVRRALKIIFHLAARRWRADSRTDTNDRPGSRVYGLLIPSVDVATAHIILPTDEGAGAGPSKLGSNDELHYCCPT